LENEKNQQARGKMRLPKTRKWILRSLILLAFVVAAAHYAPKIPYALSHESTDDAFVQGTVVPISAEVKGKVVKVFVEDNRPGTIASQS
jgi:membrane fusion protein (multidrug efflux system)